MFSKKAYCLFLIIVFVCSFFSVYADGGMYIRRPDGWDLHPESNQIAAINYENGYENLLLTIGFTPDSTATQAVWIFPVPAKPSDTVIDVIDGFPSFYGKDVKKQAKDSISASMFMTTIYTQLYLLPIAAPFFLLTGAVMMQGSSIANSDSLSKEYGVTIHERIEKLGVTSELITASSGDGFYNYLLSKGFDMPSEAKAVYGDYIGKDYTFVVSWISNPAEYANTVSSPDYYGYYGHSNKPDIGVSLTFPTEKMYFPMKPTSIYGSTEIPMTLYVVGHVTPTTFTEIENKIKVSYLSQTSYSPPSELNNFFNEKTSFSNFNYTKIELTTPSKYLKDDLWIENKAPANVMVAGIIKDNSFAVSIILLIIFSMISSLIAGFIAFGKNIKSKTQLALFGLANLLTVIGFIVITYFSKLDEKVGGSIRTKQNPPSTGIMLLLMAGVSLALSILIVVGGSILLILISFASSYSNFSSYYWQSLIQLAIVDLFAILYVTPIMFYIAAPIVWAYFKNKKYVVYLVTFNIIFLVLMILAWYLTTLLL